MIIINCKNNCFNIDDKLIECKYNDYIESIEYIDNELDEVITKETFNGRNFKYFNLNGELHNPIGAASLYYDKNGNLSSEYYFLNSMRFTKQQFLERKTS